MARLTQKVQTLCRHDEALWQATEVPGLTVQEVPWERPGQRLVFIRQRVERRLQAGGKTLLEREGYRFQALVTNLPSSVTALAVWRRYNGRADLEIDLVIWRYATLNRSFTKQLGHALNVG